MRATVAQTSFTGGELAPRVLGHTDVDRYATGMKLARNVYPVIQGGVKRREGTIYSRAALSNGANLSKLIRFSSGRDRSWLLEFGSLQVRISGTDGGVVTTLATPYTAFMIDEIDWAQADDRMYLFHPDIPVQVLHRLSDTVWTFSPAAFTQQPFAELGFIAQTTATLSAATVGAGRTITAGASVPFLASDVGRAIISGPGIGVITAVSSANVATIEITRAFASTSLDVGGWEIEGTPQTTLTPGAAGPVGTPITLILAADGWRTGDVGSLVRINGGLVRILSFSDAQNAVGRILVELSGTTAAPALAWTLEKPVWSSSYGYPRTGTIYQQRLIVAGTTRFPRTMWGSRTGEPLDFQLGFDDSDAFAFTIDGNEATPIVYVSATKSLAIFTQSGEYSARGGVERPITPTNVQITPESNHGCAQVRPETIGQEEWFVQAAARKVRAYGYRYDFDGFRSPDVTALSEHLTASGIVGLAWQAEPEQILWAWKTDGKFLSCTVDRDQQPPIIGWTLHETDGVVESMVVLPTEGPYQVWMIVRRVINGATVRYVERMDSELYAVHPDDVTADTVAQGCNLDCAVVFDNDPGVSSFSALHLAGKQIDIIADGAKMERLTVAADGSFTLPRTAKRVIAGLPYQSKVTLLNPEIATPTGSAQGQPSRTSRLVLRFLNTVGAKVINTAGVSETVPVRRFGIDSLDSAPVPFTGIIAVSPLGWDQGESEISVVQDDPYPFFLLSAIRRHQVNP